MCRKQKWWAYYYVYTNLCNSNKKDSEDGYFLYRLFARQQEENSGEILASILLLRVGFNLAKQFLEEKSLEFVTETF